MTPTLPLLHTLFNDFNSRFFANRLPAVSLRLSKAKTRAGTFRYPVAADKMSRDSLLNKCVISISTFFDLPESEMEDVLLHEMIHYYIWYHRLPDNAPHGVQFHKIMDEINRTGGRHITVSAKSDRKLSSEYGSRLHIFCIFRHTARPGKWCLTKCRRTNFVEFGDLLQKNLDIHNIHWYVSRHNYFSGFRASDTLRYYIIEETEVSEKIIPVSKEMILRGNSLYPIK